ncbi:MAG: TIGR03936 family radical SAM-associated protein [Chloroflexi bacterium]|nr:TIGR03936 family radical SAM-associated protein [Chloroflexota bacterium]MCY4111817.1 TIGR03936 family radical SAM-associated protein [Chloroflexota bacterium]
MDQEPPAEHHYLLRYAKTGDARYLSLHDVRRAWERATRRAGLPLAYSRGFRPKPRLTFGPPLAVGSEGLREVVVLSLREDVPPESVRERLACATADGLAVGDVQRVARRKFKTAWATYELQPENPPDDLATQVEQLLASPAVVIQRDARGGRPSRPRDIRPGLIELAVGPDDGLHARLSLRDGSIVTPRDLASALGVEFGGVVRTEIETELPE